MSNKESSAMEKARKLITRQHNPMTPTQASALTGINRNSIYRAQWYKAWKANKELK